MRSALAGLVAVLVAVPLALAAPGDPDPGFGTGGVVKLAAGDRYQAVDAPLVQSPTRTIFAGLLKNSSDRVFLSAVTQTGATDTSFGSGGEVHTNSIAPQRKAATALAPDGKILVAGGSNSDGKVTVERFSANGVKDNSWGSSGKVTVNLGGSYARPTGIVPVGTSSVLVSAESVASGRQVFTVAKIGTLGLDATFGSLGIGRAAFSGKDAIAHDLALLPGTNKVLLAGSVRPSASSTSSDTGLARLNANGSLDTTFGTGGRATHNITGNSNEDYAAALAPLADGGFLVTGPAQSVGMVARFAANGSLDPTFGTGGKVLGGLIYSGYGFSPVDIAVDSAGRPIVTGSKIHVSSNIRWWAAMRLTQNAGPTVLDTGFGSGGRTVLSACANNASAGPTGLALDGANILILGGCDSTARTALARLQGGSSGPPAGPVQLTVGPDSAAAGHERIPLAGLDPSAAIDAAEDVQAAAMRRTAMRRTAMRRTDILSAAMRRTAMRRTGLLSTAMRRTALRFALLSEVGLRDTTWQELLGIDAPLQTLTMEDALEINPAGVGALTLNDIDLNSTAMRRTSLAAIVLGVRPLAALPEPNGGWCAFLVNQPANCSNGVSLSETTLVDLEILGDDLSAYFDEPISLLDTDLGSGDQAAPLADFLLSELDLQIAPFRDAEASQFAAILNCGTCSGRKLGELTDAELGNATVAQLVGQLPKPSLQDLSVGDVILAMLDHAEIPYEGLALTGILGEAEHRSADLVTYRATFTLDCSQAASVQAVFAAPGDARPVPGGTTLALDGGPKRDLGNGKPAEGTKAGPFEFELAPGCQGASGVHQAVLELIVEPGSVLGPIDGAQVSIRSAGFAVDSNEVTTTVDDSRDPGDQPEQSRPIAQDALLSGHLSSATDSDFFSFTPGAGRTTISLSHLPADYDLVIYGPELGPDVTAMRRTAMRRTAMRRTPVGDAAEEPTDEAILAPDQVQDIAMRRTDLAVRGTSIQRGTTDEAASVTVGPAEAGQQFIAQVVGYNGAFHADPYVVRRTDAPAADLPACPARPLSSGLQAPFPSSIPASTKALYLVDPGRMAARDGAPATTSLLAKLNDLAAETDGLVIPVQNDPDVATTPAFAAWDANPCSPELANAVVGKINEVVDDVVEQGNGLPELRSVVVVGPDEVIPQARIADSTAIGNESEYADDATLDRNGDGAPDDSAVSAAFRFGYTLSDDPYGDFDPTEFSFAPDVALGRLVETPTQIEAQVQSYLDSDGYVAPQRSFVTGYDFLSDGAAEIFDSLSGAVPGGASQSRIDETWTAADGLAGINAAGPGFLSLNAHYDHYRALPAAAHSGADQTLLPASQANPPADSLAFTVGCHSGLNLAVGDASSASDPKLGDWAERMATRGALYAANTGFGYGDDSAVAYSERVMADYAENLVSGDVTAGQALMLAKQSVFATVGVTDVYWNKASSEATFYGLPMYRIGESGGEGESVLPEPLTGDDPADPTTRSSTPFSVNLRGRLNQVNDERGTYWRVDEQEPLVVQRRPIQPKLVEDVTADEGPAHGFVLEAFTTADQAGVNPAIARATIDLAEHEPEPESVDPFFPATVATVEPQAKPEGRRDILSLMAGSFRGDVQRLNLEMSGRVLRSSSDDYEPPVIRRVDGLVANGGFSIRVEAEADDLLGGTVMYVTDADQAGGGEVEWHRSDLSLIAPGVLSTGGTLPSGTGIPEAIVQVYDRSYNVAYSNRKVEGHTFSPIPTSGEGDPRVVLNPATPASGYYTSPPEVSLDPGAHSNATFEASYDGGEFQTFEGPFTIAEPTEGEHVVVFRGSDGSGATERFAVDRAGPTIVAEADRAADSNGWYDGPVTFTFTCGDAVSGVASCPGPVTLSEAGTNQSVSGTATDNAGHSSSTTVNGINIDVGDPTIAAETLTEPNESGWYNADGVTVRFTCADEDSGLAHCGTRDVNGAPSNATDDVTFNTEGENQSVTGTAIDLAGRSATAESPSVSIDRTAPTITAAPDRAPNANGWYDAPVTFTFSCDDALSGIGSCPEPVTLSNPGANQSVSGTATDRAGNSKSVSVNGVNVDPAVPTIAAETLTEPNESGWYNADGVTVRFTCADEDSGLAHCGTRDVNGAPSNATDDVTFNTEGENQSVTGTAIDLAGRSATAESPSVSIDRTAPTITAAPDRAPNANGWYDAPVTFTFSCDDALSGIGSCPEPVTLSNPGANQSVSGTATDRAGNSKSVSVNGVNVDPAAPTIFAQALTAPNQFGWYRSAGVTVRFSCFDQGSGLTRCGTKNVSGRPSSATDDVTISTEGRDQRITGTATDFAGLSATVQSPPVSIDRTVPAVAITTSNSYLYGSQKLAGTASDALSRVRGVEVTYTRYFGVGTVVVQADSLVCDPSGSCTWTAPRPPNGIWRASARSTDFAGNVSPATAKYVFTFG